MVADSSLLAESVRISLFVDLLDRLGEARLRATGSSMLPSISPNDLLTVQRCALADARVGDVVLYTRDERLFAHRVVAKSGAHLLTQGDSLTSQDPPVSADQFLGRVVRVERPSIVSRIVRRGQRLRRRVVAA